MQISGFLCSSIVAVENGQWISLFLFITSLDLFLKGGGKEPLHYRDLEIIALQVHEIKRRYEVGLEKLLGAETQVGQMKKELEELQPVLIKTQKETDDLLIVVERDSKAADEKRQVGLLIIRSLTVIAICAFKIESFLRTSHSLDF